MAKHGFGSPINLGKHAPVWEFQSDEVVAAIARRTKHHSVAWIAQYLDCLCQEAGRQRWAVAIDQQDTVMSRKQQIARRANSASPRSPPPCSMSGNFSGNSLRSTRSVPAGA